MLLILKYFNKFERGLQLKSCYFFSFRKLLYKMAKAFHDNRANQWNPDHASTGFDRKAGAQPSFCENDCFTLPTLT